MHNAKPRDTTEAVTGAELAVNSGQRAAEFTMLGVFRVSSSHPQTFDGRDVAGLVREIEDVVQENSAVGVTLQGWFDVSGMRADSDVMVWLQGSAAEDLQWALRQLRRTALLSPLVRVWGAIGLPHEAALAPGYLRERASCEELKMWISVSEAKSAPARSEAEAGTQGVAVRSLAGCSSSDSWLVLREADDLQSLVYAGFGQSVSEAGVHNCGGGHSFIGRRIETVEIVELLQ